MTLPDIGNRGKVSRVIKKYSLEGFGDELERRWLGQDGERESLRSLADRINKKILRRAIEAEEESLLEGEVDNIYRLLYDDAGSPGNKTEAKRKLERANINIDEIESHFVSHQAVHNYLREVRGAEFTVEREDRIEKTVETLRQLQGRTIAVTEKSIDCLENVDELTLGEYEVFTGVEVYCKDCKSQYDAVELLQQGGCDCKV
jgi:predicted transcriptional regulator